MKNKKWIILTGVVISFVALIIFLMDITYDNRDQRLRNATADQERKIEANLDKNWKTVAQEVQVLGKYADDFKEVVFGMMKGRYGDQGSTAMFQWLKEHNVQLDATVYKKVMTTIEATRLSFEREQRVLSEIAKQHADLFVTKPAKWFISGEPVKITIISSEKTKAIINDGEENKIDLFKKE